MTKRNFEQQIVIGEKRYHVGIEEYKGNNFLTIWELYADETGSFIKADGQPNFKGTKFGATAVKIKLGNAGEVKLLADVLAKAHIVAKTMSFKASEVKVSKEVQVIKVGDEELELTPELMKQFLAFTSKKKKK